MVRLCISIIMKPYWYWYRVCELTSKHYFQLQ